MSRNLFRECERCGGWGWIEEPNRKDGETTSIQARCECESGFITVEKCEHGKIDPHKFRLLCYHFDGETCRKACWCEGAGLENKT
ncbi:hypothetical protein LCGC14_1248810 [marine sediment metagenome]|uniref:Uncharacterized protein n=1 Tax=marine sediment metagenome TaxID=412755 RepID=A0A0F9L3K7_9ZZZZ